MQSYPHVSRFRASVAECGGSPGAAEASPFSASSSAGRGVAPDGGRELWKVSIGFRVRAEPSDEAAGRCSDPPAKMRGDGAAERGCGRAAWTDSTSRAHELYTEVSFARKPSSGGRKLSGRFRGCWLLVEKLPRFVRRRSCGASTAVEEKTRVDGSGWKKLAESFEDW